MDDGGQEVSAVELYFLEQDGSTFKSLVIYKPYFYVGISDDHFVHEVEKLLERRWAAAASRTASFESEPFRPTGSAV